MTDLLTEPGLALCEGCLKNRVKVSGRRFCSPSCSQKWQSSPDNDRYAQVLLERYPNGKVCPDCQNAFPVDSFLYSGKRREVCQDCGKERNRIRARVAYQDAPEWGRMKLLCNRYKISMKELEALLEVKVCVICKTESDDMHIDHNHRTGEVRGRICGLCNRGLGLFLDDPERLRSAALYLEGK